MSMGGGGTQGKLNLVKENEEEEKNRNKRIFLLVLILARPFSFVSFNY